MGTRLEPLGGDEEKAKNFEDVQRATLNILEDFDAEKKRLEHVQSATLNLLEDFDAEKKRLEDVQRATVNILEDFDSEKARSEQSQRALLNILEDMDVEKRKVAEVNQQLEAANKELEAEIDIRRRGEATLQEQASLLDLARDAIMVRQMNGTITSWNRGGEEMYGWTREEAVGKRSHAILQTQFPKPLQEIESDLLRDGRWEGELIHVSRDGRRVSAASWWALQKDEHGNPGAILEINNDITARKQIEEALKESEQRLSLALESAQLGIWELFLANDTSVRSLRHDQIFGYPSLLPKWGQENFFSHIVREDRDLVKKRFEQAFRTGLLSLECRINRADDQSLRWIAAQGRVYRDNEGLPARMVGVVSDITERKQFDQTLQEKNVELEATNKELEAFTYSVSHDLRAPLRHIDGFSRLLVEGHEAELPEEARHYLERIRQGARHMGNLVDDLLNLTRVGREEVRRQVTGLDSLVEEVLRELKPETAGREIEWRIGPLPFAECDPSLMKQVFSNLLSNAVKFTRPRERAVIEVGARTEDGRPVIYTRDNGVGFSMKYADKLFGVFQRLHRPEDFEGTGVGLATVQRIVHKHGGRVWAEAELNQGATFYFTLGAPGSEATASQ